MNYDVAFYEYACYTKVTTKVQIEFYLCKILTSNLAFRPMHRGSF